MFVWLIPLHSFADYAKSDSNSCREWEEEVYRRIYSLCVWMRVCGKRVGGSYAAYLCFFSLLFSHGSVWHVSQTFCTRWTRVIRPRKGRETENRKTERGGISGGVTGGEGRDGRRWVGEGRKDGRWSGGRSRRGEKMESRCCQHVNYLHLGSSETVAFGNCWNFVT